MRIDDKRLVIAGHRNHDRLCPDGIDESMRFDLRNQCGGHRCIQADINAHLLCLLGHQQYGVFHLALSGGLSGCHKLAAELSGSLTQDRIMSALLQYDRRFQAADSAACDQNSLGSLCFDNSALRLTPYGGISQACDVLHICVGKTIIAALVAPDAVDYIFCTAFPDLVYEVGICQLRAAHDDQVHLILFEDLLSKLCCIDSANADRQHAGFLADPGSVVNVESSGNIYRRDFKFQACGDNVAS